MTTVTMLDRDVQPPAATGLKAIKTATLAAGTPTAGAWAFYLGGRGHNKGRGSTYTNPVLDAFEVNGVKLLPIYVGRQRDFSRARGVADATDAIRLTREFGDRNRMLVADIEKFASDKDPDAALEYVVGWTATLHSNSFRSMVYGSFNLAVDIAQRGGQPKPDAVWVARFRTHKPVPGMNPHKIPGVPDGAFVSPGQRAWQYGAAFADTPGAPVTRCDIEGINVDVSVIDLEVFS